MNRSAKAWFWIAGGVILCGFACVSICITQSIFESWRARNFLGIISTMRPGTTTEADALNALRGYGAGAQSASTGERLIARVWDESSRSFLDADGRIYSFGNSGLRLLHLADKRTVAGTLFFRQGKLVLTLAMQTESGDPACLVSVRDAARDFSDLPDHKSGEAVTLDERGSPVALILVSVYPNAAQSERSKAYALSPGRLASLFPCHDARDLIPQLSR